MPELIFDYLKAADGLLEGLGRAREQNAKAAQTAGDELVKAARDEGLKAIDSMKTTREGGKSVLTPGAKNNAIADLRADRVRTRASKFRVQWLEERGIGRTIRAFKKAGINQKDARSEFVAASHRLAEQAGIFLKRIGEVAPTDEELQREIRATETMIQDARNDLVKVETATWTTLRETLVRATQGRMTKEDAEEAVRNFDVNRSLLNLSLLAHPDGVVRQILAGASEKMVQRRTKISASELPSKAHVFVGASPEDVKTMSPGGRKARVLWRVFSHAQLDGLYRNLQARAGPKGKTSSWRSLGIGYNSAEFYIPVPPELLPEVRIEMAKRRAALERDLGK